MFYLLTNLSETSKVQELRFDIKVKVKVKVKVNVDLYSASSC